ncbi:MAG: NAD(+) synthase [Planctomycetota bacterium]|nr:NAD(+) synthase [Planctomycetota bacterium]
MLLTRPDETEKTIFQILDQDARSRQTMSQPAQSIRIAAGVLNQTALDLSGNSTRIGQLIERARNQDVAVLCLPELCLTGYGCEDMFLSGGFLDAAMEELLRIESGTNGIAVSVGIPFRLGEHVFNGVALLADGELQGIVAKQNLARDGLHYEPRWFTPWPEGRVGELPVSGRSVPVGDLVFDLGPLRVGFEICEDAWVDDRPLSRLLKRGTNLVLNPSASHFAFGKNEVRKRLIKDAVSRQSVAYVYANLLGNEAGRAIYDGDAYIANQVEWVESGGRFSFGESGLTNKTLLFQPTQMPEDPGRVATGFTPRQASTSDENTQAIPGWETSGFKKEEEFSRAVALGLFDYMRRSCSSGFVISLSGGADSAAVACLCRLMFQFAVAEIGLDGIGQRLSSFNSMTVAESVKELCQRLICTAYQSTENSSQTTRDAARAVAEGCESTHHELDIEFLVSGFREQVASAIGRELTWEKDDIALQNIQARTRSPGIWMFANLRNALLLSTSNRSEAAVGYATMDGDTSGGLAPISGIDKAFLRHWLVWLETRGPQGVGAFPFLEQVNQQQPTAELRPADKKQTDEEDLMPYPVLDFIERAAVRDKLLPTEILPLLTAEFDGVERKQAVFWIRRFFRLWCRNQWKRERYAPGFHLDDESLDPKTWCRFPILSGGFEDDLNAL